MNIIEAIIELLLANIAFVILIAGGLYSVFKRQKEMKETQRSEPNRRNTETPKQTVSPFGLPAEPRANEVKEAEKAIGIGTAKMAEKVYERRTNQRQVKQAEKVSNRYQDKEDKIMNDFKVDQQELQKAVIWSEILSKPKALQKRS
ncbi:hypothetical protein [Fictibacillus norfolkensis]|jgi:ATPase subunit of ABC transporter with duplicated ATPase domains|uniref:Uncharacterized protein n=1 Tax=Fictibacillus norfolkensis TaxID=2762233 RepID=A0ABR8SMW9_9BACL|nr:hypothetical protein [Fictibacillus norfolkensis]MBD7964454.1 hypothetical protein [Fictibacillus norfolkensis]